MNTLRIPLFLLVPVMLALNAPARAGEDSTPAKPNILFLFSDDQSHRTCGCYPEAFDWVKTPNIDRLAKRGVRFANAYFGAWCTPSRAAMLTGRHPYGIESL